MSDDLLLAIKSVAVKTNASVGEAKWYMFGSAREDLLQAADIDVLVVCETHFTADVIRQVVDIDQLIRPIHLSILTHEEEREVDFVRNQDCMRIL